VRNSDQVETQVRQEGVIKTGEKNISGPWNRNSDYGRKRLAIRESESFALNAKNICRTDGRSVFTQEETMATKAYILMKVKAGKSQDVLSTLKALPGVEQAHACFGQPDIFGLVNAP
jgi:hypothetical protein